MPLFPLILTAVSALLTGLFIGFFLARRNTIRIAEHQRLCDEQEKRHREAMELVGSLQHGAVAQTQKIAQDLLENAQAKFTALSEAILKRRSEELGDNTSRSVANVLKPYEIRLEEFKRQLQELNNSNNLFRGSIKNFNDTSESLRNQTESLTRALCSGQKNQGLFGEQQLAKILKASGLAEHAEYRLQCALPAPGGEKCLIPDAVIQLPASDALLVVDSKASFTAFMDFINSDTVEDGDNAMKKHLASLRKHIQELHGKHYAEEYRKRTGRDAVNTVFMFVPSDHALQAALNKCPELWQDAVANGLLLVCPSTLLVAIHIVDIGWRRVEFNRNTDAILLKAQQLLDNIKEFLASFDEVGKSLEDARGCWEKARKKLLPTASGRGTTISDNALQLTKLGVKSNQHAKNKAANKYLNAIGQEPENEQNREPDNAS